MSELTATPVLVRPGADVRTRLRREPGRVVGPCRCAGTGQEGVAVEGPPGAFTYYTLEAFSRIFEVPSDSVQRTRPEEAAVPGRAAGYRSQGGGY
jgi:hypothetical protein